MSVRFPLSPLVGLLALGCVAEPTGSVHGSVAGTEVNFSGITLDPGEALDVQVLADPNEPPSASNPWESLLDPQDPLILSGTDALDWNGTPFYTWSADLTVVAAGQSSARWPEGGLARARVVYDGTPYPLVTIDSQDCIVGMESSSLHQTVDACRSHDSGTLTLVSTEHFPAAQAAPYLSRKAVGKTIDARAYYAGVGVLSPDPFGRGYVDGPKADLSGWMAANGFDGVDETHAQFYNRGDLGIGRDMHCRETGRGSIACYVSNYGSTADFLDDQATAFSVDPLADDPRDPVLPFATVAMEFSANQAGQPNEVRFFVYGRDGRHVEEAALDSEGDKAFPGLCLPCHGGTYDDSTHTITGASFLPFDLDQFTAPDDPSGPLGQEEAFRQLNAMVLQTRDGATDGRIEAVMLSPQPGAVDTVGAAFDRDYVPTTWQASGSDRVTPVLYAEVVKPYCQMCHVANNTIALDDLASMQPLSGIIEANTCGEGSFGLGMPHAEMTARLFWESPARAHLTSALGIDDDCDGKTTTP